MHPDSDLVRLASHKAALRRSIARHRAQGASALTRLARPIVWLDQGVDAWRRLSPWAKFAAVPLGFLLKRSTARPPRLLGTLLRWAPGVLGAARRIFAGRRGE